MATNWPPTPGSYPAWPPPEIGSDWFSCSDILTLARDLKELGFTLDNPTVAERNTFFKNAMCDEGHNVTGRMVVSPDGLRRYPFAVCSAPSHRTLLALWPPYDVGWDSGREV